MTVIAFDWKTLAADQQCEASGLCTTSRKIYELGNGFLVGYTGYADAAMSLHAWMSYQHEQDAVRRAFDYPAAGQASERYAHALLITPTGRVWKYERTPHPYELFGKFFAIGAGSDYAVAAMHLGKTAEEAAEIACLYSGACGMGVFTIPYTGLVPKEHQ